MSQSNDTIGQGKLKQKIRLTTRKENSTGQSNCHPQKFTPKNGISCCYHIHTMKHVTIWPHDQVALWKSEKQMFWWRKAQDALVHRMHCNWKRWVWFLITYAWTTICWIQHEIVYCISIDVCVCVYIYTDADKQQRHQKGLKQDCQCWHLTVNYA